jgi:hypothetical protein
VKYMTTLSKNKIVQGLLVILGCKVNLALAVPEIARYGHFTCTSCHVAPGGGGLMTTYGRDFSKEKLSTWSLEGEERLLHGLVPNSDTFLVGGDVRFARMSYKTGSESKSDFWRMQADIELGVHYGPVWATYTGGTPPKGPFEDDDDGDDKKLKTRAYSARLDLLDEQLVLRAGLFIPQYGLMLADHTAYVRGNFGLGSDDNQTQVEANFQSDLFAASVAVLLENKSFEREQKTKSGFSLGASAFLHKRHKASISAMQTIQKSDTVETTMTTYGMAGTATLTRRLFLMSEVDRAHTEVVAGGVTTSKDKLGTFLTVNFETIRGLIPYLRHEYLDTDLSSSDTSMQRFGLGSIWYPRPHFQCDFRILRQVVTSSRGLIDESDLILHYYF